MKSITRLVVIATITGALAPAAASAAPALDRAALQGNPSLVCGTDYSRNSVTGEDCVPRASRSVGERAGTGGASHAPSRTRAAAFEHGSAAVCRTDYSRNSVTGDDCVARAPVPIPDIVGAAPFPRAIADDGFSWPHAGVAGAVAVVLLAGGAAASRRRRARLAVARRRALAAG